MSGPRRRWSRVIFRSEREMYEARGFVMGLFVGILAALIVWILLGAI